jgi:hypothetical protein
VQAHIQEYYLWQRKPENKYKKFDVNLVFYNADEYKAEIVYWNIT